LMLGSSCSLNDDNDDEDYVVEWISLLTCVKPEGG
jgi:hypothetical protein